MLSPYMSAAFTFAASLAEKWLSSIERHQINRHTDDHDNTYIYSIWYKALIVFHYEKHNNVGNIGTMSFLEIPYNLVTADTPPTSILLSGSGQQK